MSESDDHAVPLTGRVLIAGPVATGKTRLTADTLARWIDRHGANNVVVLDFGPNIETSDHVLGGRLDRFRSIPSEVWQGIVDAHAPRYAGTSQDEIAQYATQNAERCASTIAAMPTSSRAVFVNDVTIAFQADLTVLDSLLATVDDAELVVMNAYAGEDFDPTHPLSARERRGVERLQSWADQVIDLGE